MSQLLGTLTLCHDKDPSFLHLLPWIALYCKPTAKTNMQILAFDCLAQLTRIYGIECVHNFNDLALGFSIEYSFLDSNRQLIEASYNFIIQAFMTLNTGKPQDKIKIIAKLIQLPKKSLFKYFTLADINIQRHLLKTMITFLNNFIGSSYFEVTQQVVNLFTAEDEVVRELAIKVYDTIMKFLSVNEKLILTTKNLTLQLYSCRDYDLFATILMRLMNLFKCKELFEEFQKMEVNFPKILYNLDNSLNPDRSPLKVMVEFIKNIAEIDKSESKKILSNTFSKLVLHPAILSSIVENLHDFLTIDFISQYLDYFIKLLHKRESMDTIIQIMSNYKRDLIPPDLISALNSENEKNENKKYTKFAELNGILTKVTHIETIATMETFSSLIENLNPYEYLVSGNCETITKFINSQTSSLPDLTAQRIIESCFQAIKYLDLPKPVDPVPGKDIRTLLNSMMQINVEFEGKTFSFKGFSDGFFTELEGFINITEKEVNPNEIAQILRRHQEGFPNNIHINDENLKHSLYTYLMLSQQILKHPKSQFYNFSIGKQILTSQNSILRAVISSLPQPRNFQKTVATVKLIPIQNFDNTIEQPTKYYQCSLIEGLINLLDAVYAKNPQCEFVNSGFNVLVKNLIKLSPSGAVTWCSYPVWLVKNRPYLFNLDIRHLSAYLLYSMLPLSACAFATHFRTPIPKIRCATPRVDIKRSAILSDGLNVINFLRSQNICPNYYLDGSPSSVNEFLWNYSREFFNVKLAEHQIIEVDGYILPQPTAPDSFYLHFGILLGKAVSSLSCLARPIHPDFFALLKNKLNTDKENIVTQTLTNDKMPAKMKLFSESFGRVISIFVLDIFSPKEITDMLHGKVESFDADQDLKTFNFYIQDKNDIPAFCSSYKSFEIKEREKFLTKIVGAPQIPFGNMSFLYPPISIKIGIYNAINLRGRVMQIVTGSTPDILSTFLKNLY
ncbi:hypothetical protein TVAG_306260 [Trichomonas vaginalis G3]|uniref:HECT domain-containing protein n=1 Tax=Trichomonas vaginalis (strain ATCC PRA-98 / G3) TaxID=412133 RepID=A2DNB7_TRIV3|nr:Hect, E3 ligase catalytic domain family [Trichomonas vaginalis G3]EAY18105.1 hypothetical protein TVAG_306260 [Trichomonas vaginalis G3]KAI5492382.1 Hect, E3 ligase catalytic domain family [Trichomonas vaginalis G3]|eukprot:XP_001579091.1 hypothetical protein [Trichomonas vaginalis G3]